MDLDILDVPVPPWPFFYNISVVVKSVWNEIKKTLFSGNRIKYKQTVEVYI